MEEFCHTGNQDYKSAVCYQKLNCLPSVFLAFCGGTFYFNGHLMFIRFTSYWISIIMFWTRLPQPTHELLTTPDFFFPIQVTRWKAGHCPRRLNVVPSSKGCVCDDDCAGDDKCCIFDCGSVCVPPAFSKQLPLTLPCLGLSWPGQKQ